MAEYNLFQFGPTGRGIFVDASGNLNINTDPSSSGYIFGYGEEGHPILVDSSVNLKVNDVNYSHTHPTQLDDLTDVDTSGVASGQFLEYNGTQWQPGDLIVGLDELLDVNTSTASSGQHIEFDGTLWRNVTASNSTQNDGGYEFTGGFEGKALPAQGSAPWSGQASIQYTQDMVNSGTYLQFSLDPDVQGAYDQSYWSDPSPLPTSGIGLFGGAYMPTDVTSMFDFTVTNNNAQGNYTGSLDFSECKTGDLALCRFDFNITPQIANTTVEVGLWWQTRDPSGVVTFEFDLAASPVFYGVGSVGKKFLVRPLISAYFASEEDVNALALPYIKSDNPVLIEPLTLLTTIQR